MWISFEQNILVAKQITCSQWNTFQNVGTMDYLKVLSATIDR